MKRILIAALVLLAASTLALGQASKNSKQGKRSDADKIIALEKQAWEAWKNKNGAFFQTFLADDAVMVGGEGIGNKADAVKGISSMPCEVRSYSLDNFKVTMLDKNTALLTYSAKQDYTCNGKPGAPSIWASSIFVKRGGKWLNVMHQESTPEPGT